MIESKTARTEFKNAEYCGSRRHETSSAVHSAPCTRHPARKGASSRRLLQFFLAMAIMPAEAQTFSALHSFSGADGANPNGGLVLSGGTLYGTAEAGGS